jgi:class 3 adenylate cyclase
VGLDDDALRQLGVERLGHRLRLLEAVEALRADGAATSGGARVRPTMPDRIPVEGFPPERRQVTVAFCDLVGSTAMAAALDPEDLRTLLAEYHAAVARIATGWGGHVAQFLGDGVLLLFGYPVAHEDAAKRAVRAGRAVVATCEAIRPGNGPALRRVPKVGCADVRRARGGAGFAAGCPGGRGCRAARCPTPRA